MAKKICQITQDMFKNLSITAKFIAIVITITVSIFVVSGFLTYQIKTLQEPLITKIPKEVVNIKESQELDNLAQFIKYYDEVLTQSARNYAFTGNLKWKTRYKENEPKLDKVIKQAISKGDTTDKKFFNDIDRANLALVNLEYKSIYLVDHGSKSDAVKILEGDKYSLLKDEYKNVLDEYVKRRGSVAEKSLQEATIVFTQISKNAKQSVDFSIQALIIINISIILGAFAATVFIMSLILSPIKKLKKDVDIINSGNINHQIDIRSGDEIGALASSFSEMIKKLSVYQNDLKIEVKEKTLELSQKLEEFSKQNAFLEDTKKAVINILEDTNELEGALKAEKENVEKKIEERTKELNEEKVKLSASISSLTLGFIMTDRNNNNVTINQAARDILCASDTSPLATVKECTLDHIEDELKGLIDLRVLIDRSISKNKIILIKEINFRNRVLKIAITPIIENDKAIGAVILIEDITEAKILERSKDEFFSIASHELRTPLTSIKGNSSLIQEYYADKLNDKNLKEMIDDIHESSVRLISIVNDFLDMSRLEQGRIEFKKEVLDIVPLIEHIVYEISKLAKDKGIFMKFDQPAGIHPNVTADSARTKQIIYNLLGNALKFTAKGGVTITIDTNDKLLNVHVSDTGQGVPISSQSLLFRKFQQAENNILTRDGTQGTGLGLYISRLMAQGMGGDIILEKSEEKKGSSFLFSLPLAMGKDIKETD